MYEGLEFTRMVRWEEHRQRLSLNQALQLPAHATLGKSCQFLKIFKSLHLSQHQQKYGNPCQFYKATGKTE